MRILVDAPRWFVSPANTDWRVSFDVADLVRSWPDAEVRVSRCLRTVLAINGGYLFHAAARRLRLGDLARRLQPHPLLRGHRLCPRELERFRADAVFSHGILPINAGSIPVVWLTGYASDAEIRAEGIGAKALARGRAGFRALAERAAIVAVSSSSAADRLRSDLPPISDRVRVLPFYRPYIRPAAKDRVVDKQRQSGPLRVLFVGGEARRKGLAALVEAVDKLHRERRGAVVLEIVSGMRDGPVPIPPSAPVTCLGALPAPSVQERFAAAQVFAMPSLREAYGIVFVEAMAQGCVVVAPDKEPQIGIVDGGRAGVLVDPRNSDAIASALARLLDDPKRREVLALAGHELYLREYHHEVVARRFREAFENAVRLGAPVGRDSRITKPPARENAREGSGTRRANGAPPGA